VEESFQAARNETSLDHYQVRKLSGWYRHVTLAMCAHAWLEVTAAASRPPPETVSSGPRSGRPGQRGGHQPVDNFPGRGRTIRTIRLAAVTVVR
jgi:hypothetical protein